MVEEPSVAIEMREMVKLTQKLVEEIQEQRRQEKADREARQQQKRRENRADNPRCYNCNIVGHLARNCRKPQAQQGRAGERGSALPLQTRRVQFEEQNRGRNHGGSTPNANFPDQRFRERQGGSRERSESQERGWRQAENMTAGEVGHTPAMQRPANAPRW